MTELSADVKNRALSDMANDLIETDAVFEFDGPVKVTVRRHDGTFTNQVVEQENFLVERFFLAKDGEEIFAFTPEDPNDLYEAVEIRAKKVDDCFPALMDGLLTSMLVRSHAQDEEQLNALRDAQTVPEMMRLFWSLEATNEELAVENDSDGMKANPFLGMF